ncbi:hypothetical protein ACS0TY_032241 [Phlomoides rotata]
MDGQEVVTGSTDGNIYVYDLEAKKVSIRDSAHVSGVNTVCFAEESGHLIYSGSDDNFCKLAKPRIMGRKAVKYKKKEDNDTLKKKSVRSGSANEDMMDDEIDAFHKNRDVVPLNINEDLEESDKDNEQPVFDSEYDDEDDDDDDDDDKLPKGLAAKKVAKYKLTLFDITKQICDAVQARGEQDKHHNVIMLPEGLIESFPEVYALLQEIHG